MISGCFHHLFLPCDPHKLWERSSQMVPRGSTPLSSGSNHSGGYKAGPEGRQGDHRQAEGEKVSSYHLPPGNSATDMRPLWHSSLVPRRVWPWPRMWEQSSIWSVQPSPRRVWRPSSTRPSELSCVRSPKLNPRSDVVFCRLSYSERSD